jgi:iron(III) transport system substrate-binding protein
VSKADLPKSFEEFAQRKEWAGKVAIDFTDIEWLRGMTQFYGEQKGTALIREIAANLKPVLTDGRLAMARSVAAGEYFFALNNFVNLTLNVKLAGGSIDFFPLDPVPLYFAQVAVSSSAPNPNTARLAANFMLSRDCQVFYTKFGRLPTRTDVETNPPGIIKEVEARKVVRTQFSQEEEKRLRQMFEALLRKR